MLWPGVINSTQPAWSCLKAQMSSGIPSHFGVQFWAGFAGSEFRREISPATNSSLPDTVSASVDVTNGLEERVSSTGSIATLCHDREPLLYRPIMFSKTLPARRI